MRRAAPPSSPRADRSPGDDGCVARLLAAVHPVHVPIPRCERASDGLVYPTRSRSWFHSGPPPPARQGGPSSCQRRASGIRQTAVCRSPHPEERHAHAGRAPDGDRRQPAPPRDRRRAGRRGGPMATTPFLAESRGVSRGFESDCWRPRWYPCRHRATEASSRSWPPSRRGSWNAGTIRPVRSAAHLAASGSRPSRDAGPLDAIPTELYGGSCAISPGCVWWRSAGLRPNRPPRPLLAVPGGFGAPGSRPSVPDAAGNPHFRPGQLPRGLHEPQTQRARGRWSRVGELGAVSFRPGHYDQGTLLVRADRVRYPQSGTPPT